jgi:hypothetical protein
MDIPGAIRAVDWGAVFPVVTLLLGVAVTAAFEEIRSRAADRRAKAARIEARLYDQRMQRLVDTRKMLLAMTADAAAGKLSGFTPQDHPNASIRLLGDVQLSLEYMAIVSEAERAAPHNVDAWLKRILAFRNRALRALITQEERVAKGEEPINAPLGVSAAEASEAAARYSARTDQ